MSTGNWIWHEAASRAGVTRDGRFNAGGMVISHPSALICRSSDGRVSTHSGADIMAIARRTASALKKVGVCRGDRVAGLLSRSIESFTIPLGVWQLGAIYVPLFSGFGPEAIQVRLEDSGSAFVVTDSQSRPNLALVEDRLGTFVVVMSGRRVAGQDFSLSELMENGSEDIELADTNRRDPATIMYTSGTSGQPKGCVIPHSGIITLWPYIERCLALTRADVLFSSADTGWSFGLYTTGLSPLSLGHQRVLFEGKFRAAVWWETIRSLDVSHFASAPTGFRQLVADNHTETAAPSLVAATSAGEPLTPAVFISWQEREGIVIHDSYGLTEVGMVIANLRGQDAGSLPVAGSMGVEVPGFEVCLVDANGERVANGERGRIAVRDNGYLLSSTYWGRDAEWRARLADDWWVTEDVAYRDEIGRYWYVGRADDVIVTAGYNIGPFEVEKVLLEHPLVLEAACIAEPDERKGHVVSAYVVLAEDEPPGLVEQLRQSVGERIGWHAAPKHIRVSLELPRTESGKVIRRYLRPPAR